METYANTASTEATVAVEGAALPVDLPAALPILSHAGAFQQLQSGAAEAAELTPGGQQSGGYPRPAPRYSTYKSRSGAQAGRVAGAGQRGAGSGIMCGNVQGVVVGSRHALQTPCGTVR